MCDRWQLEKSQKAETVTAPHPRAGGSECNLQQSDGGYRLPHGKVRFFFFLFSLKTSGRCVSRCVTKHFEQSFVQGCVAVFSRYKMSGELPLLSLRISDDKLRNVLGLIESIPLPKTRPAAHGATSSYTSKVRRAGWPTDRTECGSSSHFCRSDKLEKSTGESDRTHNGVAIDKLLSVPDPGQMFTSMMSWYELRVRQNLVVFRQVKLTPQLTPRRPPTLADQRSSIMFESCETISITSLGNTPSHINSLSHKTHFLVITEFFCFSSFFCAGSEEDLFYDAPSSPIGDRPFFPDNPVPLRSVDLSKRRSLFKEDAPKNMTDLILTFEISEVQSSRLQRGVISFLEPHCFIIPNYCSLFFFSLCPCLLGLSIVFCSAVSPVWGSGDHRAPPGHRGPGHRAETAHL